MAELIYAIAASVDGYIADEDGNFDWAAPSEEVHAFFNDLQRSVGTFLCGRRMYDVMQAWDTMPLSELPDVEREFAELWRATDKIVYSSTLDAVSHPRTRLEPTFDPEAVRAMKAEAERDISIGGPGLAAEGIRAGLVDRVHLILVPTIVGGGTRALPDGAKVDLELESERRFANGAVHLGYRATPAA